MAKVAAEKVATLVADTGVGRNTLAEANAKVPSRTRGVKRVRALLEAAADVFVERGFDAATMTEIAKRAGASIGSLYQFFPTKESLADVLRAEYGEAISTEFEKLAESGKDWSGNRLSQALIRITTDVFARHKAFPPLMVVRDLAGVNVTRVRERLQSSLYRLFEALLPRVDPEELRAIVVVVRNVIRIEADLELERKERDKEAARREVQIMLSTYLSQKIANP